MTVPLVKLSEASQAKAKHYHERELELAALLVDQPIRDPKGSTPRFERWKLNFDDIVDGHKLAKTIDHFGFQIGAIGGRIGIDYVFNVRFARPSISVVRDPAKEKRLYLILKPETHLGRLSADWFRLAKVEAKDRTSLLLVPEKVEQLLSGLEHQYVNKSNAASIRDVNKTVFKFGHRDHPFDVWVDSCSTRADN